MNTRTQQVTNCSPAVEELFCTRQAISDATAAVGTETGGYLVSVPILMPWRSQFHTQKATNIQINAFKTPVPLV